MGDHWRTVDWRAEVRDADLLGEIERSVRARLSALAHLPWLDDERATLLDHLVPHGASALERIDTVSRVAQELDRSTDDQRSAFFAGLLGRAAPATA
ncbi:hypothetical protein FB382_003970 [Nocardioides ginsengisegetis]|uniref:Uncharacterized protein n=1 Tax=Nocardioides ginsengisegetis TaxID=661491 RepID=A0A7W3J3Q5_9ACTN|nr:hypothetical protein [Nocardioides ginsengisegetis]MBA8805625.1 hypothetical protein [Nocardioides ginsengisegetis]